MKISQEVNKKRENKCINGGLKMLGDFWILSIIDTLSIGEKRFCQLQRDLNMINPTTLTNRLKLLEKNEIVKSKKETLDKLSVVYTLTNKGQDIIPILKEIKTFSSKHL